MPAGGGVEEVDGPLVMKVKITAEPRERMRNTTAKKAQSSSEVRSKPSVTLRASVPLWFTGGR